MLPKAFLGGQTRTVLLFRRSLQTTLTARSSGGDYWEGPEKAAGREVVGHGEMGDPSYSDRIDYWYPAIRFRKDDDVILPIKEKELGDWKALTFDEKKLLYRYSFQQTLAEYEAPTGYWKPITAGILFVLSLSFFYTAFLKKYVYPPIPPTFENEFREAMTEKELVLWYNPTLGKGAPATMATKYDYENNRWKV
ncbi:cytochrome c oxidase subunit IV domain-containing protein [Ditylenchus destructor]|nr:cytochrome c oxidase subunit IV domain-containing protein [Ditylenchus destructor]